MRHVAATDPIFWLPPLLFVATSIVGLARYDYYRDAGRINESGPPLFMAVLANLALCAWVIVVGFLWIVA